MDPVIDPEGTDVPVIRQRKSKTLARLKKLKAQKALDQLEAERNSSTESHRLENLDGTSNEDVSDNLNTIGHDSGRDTNSQVTDYPSQFSEASDTSHLLLNNDQSRQDPEDAAPPWHREHPAEGADENLVSDDRLRTGSSISEKVSLDVESLSSDNPSQPSGAPEETGHPDKVSEVPSESGWQSSPEKGLDNMTGGEEGLDNMTGGDSVDESFPPPEDVGESAITDPGEKDKPPEKVGEELGMRCEILEDIKESNEDVTDSDDDLLCIGRTSSVAPASSTNSHDALQQQQLPAHDPVDPREISEDEAIGSASSDDGLSPVDQSGYVLGQTTDILKAAGNPGRDTSSFKEDEVTMDRFENTEMEISSDASIPVNSVVSSEPGTSGMGNYPGGRTYSEPPLGSTMSLSETNRSFMSTGTLLPITTQNARRNQKRSYLVGGLRNTGSLLGREELERNLPDRKIRVFVSTWNMHEEKLLPDNLEDLVLPEESAILQDIYVIGTQESTPDANEWAIRIQETLGTTHILLHKASLGVLHLLIFIRRDLYWFCSPVEEDSISTRPGSMIKTKGAVAVSFTFFGTSLLFIVSHFTSGDENLSNRIQDYTKIIKTLNLPIKVAPTRKYNVDKDDITTRFDAVFWCGDFNFRLMETRAKVENWATQLRDGNMEDFNILLQHDQLRKSMQKNQRSKVEYTVIDSIFKGFQEGDINFLPTYKYNPGEDVYDTSSKARIPSYTDRVLFKPRKAGEIEVLFYNSCPTIKCSDHRPVYGIYEVKIRPGRDDILCGTPSFAKEVFVEANRRRAVGERSTSNRGGKGQKSAICSIS